MAADAESIELADIVRAHGDDYLERYGARTTWHQRRVLLDIARCRTAAMGGHVEVCSECGYLQNAYNSCRNPLPQVPGPGAPALGCRPRGRAPAGALLPPGVHAAR